MGALGWGVGGRGLPQVTSGQGTVKIHQRHPRRGGSRHPQCRLYATALQLSYRHLWRTVAFLCFFFSHLSPAAVGVKALWLIKFKGIGAADVDIVVASSQGRFWM